MMETLLAYITTKDKEEARRIGKALVERQLAACVNILSPMESHYLWEGKLESSEECVLIAKTVSAKERALQSLVQELHSYTLPCILFLKADGGNQSYIDWIHKSCKGVNQ